MVPETCHEDGSEHQAGHSDKPKRESVQLVHGKCRANTRKTIPDANSGSSRVSLGVMAEVINRNNRCKWPASVNSGLDFQRTEREPCLVDSILCLVSYLERET